MQRNPIIAEVLHRGGLIEKWSRGTYRVADRDPTTQVGEKKLRDRAKLVEVAARGEGAGE